MGALFSDPNHAFLALGGIVLGLIFGGFVTVVTTNWQIRLYQEDVDNHRHAALTLARKLSIERAKVDVLETQVESLMARLQDEKEDPADAWKKDAERNGGELREKLKDDSVFIPGRGWVERD